MSEATWYKLDNPYLTPTEKISVETWFQLPGNIMQYVFWFMAISNIYNPVSLWVIFGVTLGWNLVAGVLNWYIYNERVVRFLGLTIFHPYVTGLLGLGIAVFLFIHGAYLLAAVSVFTGFFSFLFLELHMILYSLLCKKSGLHPKYYFAKYRLNAELPF